MSGAPLVSIVVPSRHGRHRLPTLFEALSQQSLTRWEAIVVLDGDIDGSEAVVVDAGKSLPVRSIVFDDNRGRPSALNAGFAAAAGEVLVRCDDDMRPGPHYVRDHLAAHQDADVGVVGLVRNIYPDTAYARAYGRHWDEKYRVDAYGADPSDRWHYWAGNCSVTQSQWAAVGPYDTDFRSYGWEDVDWGYRLMRAGVQIEIDPRLEIEHHGPAPTTAARARRSFHAGAARSRFVAKHGVGDSPVVRHRSAWDSAVEQLQLRLDEPRIERLAATVDHAASVLPRPVARKLIALVVESSSKAGVRHGGTATVL